MMRTEGAALMAARTAIRATALAGLIVALDRRAWRGGRGRYGAHRATGADRPRRRERRQFACGDARRQQVGGDRSARDIKDVLVADPKIANAVVRSSRRAYIIGIAVGQTNVFFFDASGKQIAGFDIAVTRDLNGIRQAIKEVIPDSDVTIEGIGQGVVLSGTVADDAESQQAYDIAVRLLNDGTVNTVGQGNKVVNAIVVRGRDQVMLKVTVAEVERDLVKQLGINLSGSLGYGTAVVNFNNTNPFSAYGQSLSGSDITGGWQSISASLQAMEQAGVIRTLAEPSLTAISGETATFVAGGQFPVLNGYSCSATSSTPGAPVTCQPSISFKNFGVSLNFTPVVLSGGRISLKVMTEVSDLSSNNSLTIPEPGSNATATIPSIRTRRADTTVEIPSGGSLAMAGMIQDNTRHNINGFPGSDGAPHSWPVVQEQRLHQSAHRADDSGDALYRARRRGEGSLAA